MRKSHGQALKVNMDDLDDLDIALDCRGIPQIMSQLTGRRKEHTSGAFDIGIMWVKQRHKS